MEKLSNKRTEVQNQAEKIQRSIEISEQREDDLRSQRDVIMEQHEAESHALTLEMEELREHMHVTKQENEELLSKVEKDKKNFEEYMDKLNGKRSIISEEYENHVVQHNKESEQVSISREQYDTKLQETREDLAILEEKQREKQLEADQQTEKLSHLQEEEQQALLDLHSINYDEMDPEFRALVGKIDRLQAQDSEISMKLHRYRENYVFEVDCVEQEEMLSITIARCTSEKSKLAAKRKVIQESIDILQKELQSKEEQNEHMRQAFAKHREEEERFLKYEKSRQRNLCRFVALRSREINQAQQLLHNLKATLKSYEDHELRRNQLAEIQVAVITEEKTRFDRSWEQKFGSITSELHKLADEYNREKMSFDSLDFDISGILGEDISRDIEQLMHELGRRRLFFAAEELGVTTLKSSQQLIADKIQNINSLKQRMADFLKLHSQMQREVNNDEGNKEKVQETGKVVFLQKEIYKEQIELYQMWKDMLNQDMTLHSNESLQEIEEFEEQLIDYVTKTISTEDGERNEIENDRSGFTGLDDGKILLMETSAEMVIARKKRLARVVRLIETSEFNNKIHRDLLDKWRKLLISQNKIYHDRVLKENQKRREFIATLSAAIEKEKRRLVDAQHSIKSVNIQEREDNLKKARDSERQRMSSLSEYISVLEEKINGLFDERGALEAEWDQITKKEKVSEGELQETSEQFRLHLEKQYGNTTESQKIIEASQRLSVIRRLVKRSHEIQNVLEKAVHKALSTQPESQESLSLEDRKQILSIQLQSRERIKHIQGMRAATERAMIVVRHDLDKIAQEIHVKRGVMQRLELENSHSYDIQYSSFQYSEQKKVEYELLLKQLDEQISSSRLRFEQDTLPFHQKIEDLRHQLNEFAKQLQNKRRQIARCKLNAEKAESKFSSQISTIRGQRQQMRHRLELKLRAIENLKRQVDEESVGPSSSHEILQQSGMEMRNSSRREKSVPKGINRAKKSSPGKTEQGRYPSKALEDDMDTQQHDPGEHQKEHSYFNMYNNKRTSQGSGFDHELYDALLGQHPKAVSETSQDPPYNNKRANPDRSNPRSRFPTTAHLRTTIGRRSNRSEIDEVIQENNPIRLFGPHTRSLAPQSAKHIIESVMFMLNGITVYKVRDPSKGRSSGLVPRHIYLSQELTRLEIKDKSKKVPESFIKIEHIEKVQVSKPTTARNNFSFSIILRDSRIKLLTPDEGDYQQWIEGLQILMSNKANLFYLRYNLKELIKQ